MPRGESVRCPLFLGTWSSPFAASAGQITDPASASLTWVANLAVYVPFWIPAPFPVARLWVQNAATVTGHFDVGVYTSGGSLIVSAGTTAQSGATTPQYVSAAALLGPGSYYFGFACDGTTTAVTGLTAWTAAVLRSIGCLQQALGSALLPAAMAPAVMANALFPWVGMTQTPSGF